MKSIVGVYKIENIITGKFYIGSSKNITIRWQEHIRNLSKGCHLNNHLQFAWNKYGAESFSFIVLEYCEIDFIIEREQYYLDFYEAVEKGYNILRVAGSSPEIRSQRISESKLDHSVSEDTRRKISLANTGKVRTDEMKERANVTRKRGFKRSEEIKRKISESKQGHPVSDETREKISKARLSMSEERKKEVYPMREETKKKISEARMGKKRGPYKKRIIKPLI